MPVAPLPSTSIEVRWSVPEMRVQVPSGLFTTRFSMLLLKTRSVRSTVTVAVPEVAGAARTEAAAEVGPAATPASSTEASGARLVVVLSIVAPRLPPGPLSHRNLDARATVVKGRTASSPLCHRVEGGDSEVDATMPARLLTP